MLECELTGKLLLYRLVCKNGAIAPVKFGVVRRSANNKLPVDTTLKHFVEDFEHLHTEAARILPAFDLMRDHEVTSTDFVNFSDALGRVVMNPSFGNFKDTAIDSLERATIGYDLLGVPNYKDIRKAAKALKKHALEHPFASPMEDTTIPGFSYYDLYNRITALPHSFYTDFSRKIQSEKLGGRIIEHVLANFSNN